MENLIDEHNQRKILVRINNAESFGMIQNTSHKSSSSNFVLVGSSKKHLKESKLNTVSSIEMLEDQNERRAALFQ